MGGDGVIGDVVIVVHTLVDDALRGELNHAVGHGLDKLMVVRGEQHIALERLQGVVEGLDGFQVQMVGRRVQNQRIGIFIIIREIMQRIFSPPDSTFDFL